MKLNFIKQAGGVLIPASDLEADKLNRFKTGETYEIDIKLTRNGAFHGKVFAFFTFCFNYWAGPNEFQCQHKQFDSFREDLTILAGFYVETYNLDGSIKLKAQSISYASMDQGEFEMLYNALISAAIKNILPNADQTTIDRLYSFF